MKIINDQPRGKDGKYQTFKLIVKLIRIVRRSWQKKGVSKARY